METFETPQPIAVVVDVSVRADIWIVAGNRTDTVVNVQPRTATRTLDVKVAEQTTVDYSDGRLQVRLRPQRRHTWFSDGGAVDITVEVPIGCSLELKSGMGDLRCEGEFSSAELKTEMGHVRLDHCTDLKVHTGMGDVTVERVAGRAEIKTGSGKIRIREIDGIASVKNGNGGTHIVDAAGELRVSAANGDVALERAGATTTIKASNGDITVGEVLARNPHPPDRRRLAGHRRPRRQRRVAGPQHQVRARPQRTRRHHRARRDGRQSGGPCPQRLRRHHRAALPRSHQVDPT